MAFFTGSVMAQTTHDAVIDSQEANTYYTRHTALTIDEGDHGNMDYK